MSAYTKAWIASRSFQDSVLRDELHEALTVLLEAAEVLECDDWRNVADIARAKEAEHQADSEHHSDRCEDELDELRAEHEKEVQKLENQLKELREELSVLQEQLLKKEDERVKLRRDLVAVGRDPDSPQPLLPLQLVREHYARVGLRVIRGEGLKDDRSADDLYREASAIDEQDPKKAEELYLRVLQLEPKHACARTNLGNIWFKRGEGQKAQEAYSRALEDDPYCSEAHYNLGYCFLDQGEPKSAIPRFERSLELDPRFADCWYNLALAYEQVREYLKAKPCWAKYIELAPKGLWVSTARSRLQAIEDHLGPAPATTKPKRGRKKKTP